MCCTPALLCYRVLIRAATVTDQSGKDAPGLHRRYASYLVPAWLRKQISASTLRTIKPDQKGLEHSVVTDVKLLRKCGSCPEESMAARFGGRMLLEPQWC